MVQCYAHTIAWVMLLYLRYFVKANLSGNEMGWGGLKRKSTRQDESKMLRPQWDSLNLDTLLKYLYISLPAALKRVEREREILVLLARPLFRWVGKIQSS